MLYVILSFFLVCVQLCQFVSSFVQISPRLPALSSASLLYRTGHNLQSAKRRVCCSFLSRRCVQSHLSMDEDEYEPWERERLDENDDTIFYEHPRLVYHADIGYHERCERPRSLLSTQTRSFWKARRGAPAR